MGEGGAGFCAGARRLSSPKVATSTPSSVRLSCLIRLNTSQNLEVLQSESFSERLTQSTFSLVGDNEDVVMGDLSVEGVEEHFTSTDPKSLELQRKNITFLVAFLVGVMIAGSAACLVARWRC